MHPAACYVAAAMIARATLPGLLVVAAMGATIAGLRAASQPLPARSIVVPAPLTVSTGWLMQDVANVDVTAEAISSVGFAPAIYDPQPYAAPPTASANPPADPGHNGDARPQHSSAWTQAPGPSSRAWYRATVPGTVLTTLVDNHVYPEPLYGENNRPNIIPESLCRTSYWYRTELDIPASYDDRRVWLTFDGINYAARRSARANAAMGPRLERRRDVARRADVRCDARLGLDARDSRSQHGHLAEGHTLGDRPRRPSRSVRGDVAAAASHG
jgi:hypothetical protein